MVIELMRGAVAMGFAVGALFFLYFWHVSRDRLFAFFAVAFLALSVNRVLVGLYNAQGEHTTLLYSVRLLAFLVILAAIVDKNVRRQGENP